VSSRSFVPSSVPYDLLDLDMIPGGDPTRFATAGQWSNLLP
jgi:hypothetical protein